MSTVAATLGECHRLRKHLKALQEEIERGPRVLKAHQTRLAAEQQAHKDHHDDITKLKLKQRDDEGTLKQTETRLTKLEQQLTGISVSKEYEAKASEIRQAKEKRAASEDAILGSMGALEEAVAAIPGVEKKWADAQAEYAQYQTDAKERLERMQRDQADTRAALAAAEATLSPKVKTTYDFLVKTHGPDALAAVKGRDCQGCRTGLTEQKVMEIRHGSFIQCPICGRMLYPAE